MEFEKKTRQTPAKKTYDKKYRQEKMYSIAFRLSKVYDQELIETYESIPEKTAWFKSALKKYKEEHK